MLTDLGPLLGHSPLTPLLHALHEARPGAALEFGVATGTTLLLIGDAPHLHPVIGFDSFKGLPEDWRPGWERGKFARRRPPRVPTAELVIGWFDASLPRLIDSAPEWLPHISLIHIDCDLYSSTATVFRHLGPHITPGTVIVFDEFHSYPGADQHEAKAWCEWVEATGTRFRALGHGPEQLVVRVL